MLEDAGGERVVAAGDEQRLARGEQGPEPGGGAHGVLLNRIETAAGIIAPNTSEAKPYAFSKIGTRALAEGR